MAGITARAEIDVDSSPAKVWRALTEPTLIEKYFFGSRVETTWQPGSSIRWKGEWKGEPYEDKGEVLEVEPNRLLKFTHFSPLSGLPDKPENYHTLVLVLEEQGTSTHVALSQDNNNNEAEAEHSAQNWRSMLAGLKKIVEGG